MRFEIGEQLFKKASISAFIMNLLRASPFSSFYKTALLQYIKYAFKLEAIIKNYYEKHEDQLILSIDI